MHIVVIGGSGHIGTYLVPRLVEAGHQVTNVSRARRQPYQAHPGWETVRQVVIDRAEAEASGAFGPAIAALAPDVVIDLICFTPSSAEQLVAALQGRVRQFLHCGTIWVHGPSAVVPTTEEQPRAPFGEYGVQKAAIEQYLLRQAAQAGFPAVILHPGHIVGPGWAPLNPAGHFNPAVFEGLARGEPLCLPNFGLETVHHVHAYDVAQAFQRAVEQPEAAIGQSFHVVSAAALTLRGYAEAVASWFGRPARLSFRPWDEWQAGVDPKDAAATLDHIAHSPHCSIAKITRWLGYQPRYTSLEAVQEALNWLIAHGQVVV